MMTAFNHTRCCHVGSYRPRFLADLTRKVILDSEVSNVLSVLVELSATGNCALSYRASFGNDRLERRARDNCVIVSTPGMDLLQLQTNTRSSQQTTSSLAQPLNRSAALPL
eukprot:234826-Hanusia_phi.AAC.1